MNQSEELIKQKASDSGIKLISVIILLALVSVGLYNPLKSIIFPDNQYINTYQSSESFVNYIENMTWDLLEKNSSKDEFDFYQKNQYKDVTYYLQVKDELATPVTNTNLLPNQILSKSKQSSSFYIHIKLDENLSDNLAYIYAGWNHKHGNPNFLTKNSSSEMGGQVTYNQTFIRINQ